MKMVIEGQAVCVVNLQSKLYAFSNTCPHLGESLSKGTLNYLGEIVCPWHSYRFNLKSGEETMRRCRDLRIYNVAEASNGEIIIDI